MRKLIIVLAAFTMVMSFEACKKKKAFKNEDGQVSEDNRNVQQQTDDAVSDGDNTITYYPSLAGKQIQPPPGVQAIPCGATVDTTGLYTGTVLLTFDNVTVCNNRKRGGTIRLTIQNYAQGMRWKDTGCVMQLDYTNYIVTRASDGKSIKFNGTQYVTNVVGGNIWTLILGGTVIRTVTGNNMNVTFDDGSTATWNINRKYTYTKSGSVYACQGEGIGSSNGISQLENWGTTRAGDAFTSQVTTPVIWNTTCGAWAPIQGALNVKVVSKDFDLKVTLGVDNSGNPVTVGANQCAYGWKVEWTHKNKTKDKLFAYW